MKHLRKNIIKLEYDSLGQLASTQLHLLIQSLLEKHCLDCFLKTTREESTVQKGGAAIREACFLFERERFSVCPPAL